VKSSDEIYHEELWVFWGWLVVGLFFATAVAMIVLFFVQRAHGPIGENPAPDLVYLIMAACFMATGLFMIFFVRLTISMDPRGITAGYGPFRHFEPWGNIASIERNHRVALLAFGGWGIRRLYRKGGWVLVYNVMGAPILLLTLKTGKKKYFGFSTKHPDDVTALIKSWKH